jgi:hypothetical protein
MQPTAKQSHKAQHYVSHAIRNDGRPLGEIGPPLLPGIADTMGRPKKDGWGHAWHIGTQGVFSRYSV